MLHILYVCYVSPFISPVSCFLLVTDTHLQLPELFFYTTPQGRQDLSPLAGSNP